MVGNLVMRQRYLSSSILKRWSSVSRHFPVGNRLIGLRNFQSGPEWKQPEFAFAFDIDGVLLRMHDPIPGAREALKFLQSERIPFILLTNGGGKSEQERIDDLQQRLDLPLDTSMFVQSHTPFAALDQYKDKTILVIGGEEDKCRHVAESYGFKSVVTPADILVQYPSVWPFAEQFLDYYKETAEPLPKPIVADNPEGNLKVDAIFVYNDPRDWGLDSTIILDLLLSRNGILGTLSSKNGDASLPNKGYQQDGQPPLYYSNPDLWWAAKFHLPRLGQGAFREAFLGLWTAVTGGEKDGVTLNKTIIGKPYHLTYEFAERRLLEHRKALFKGQQQKPLSRVYMIGDNPESDIAGGNSFKSPHNTKWSTILVETGVHQNGKVPSQQPTTIVKDVHEAVKWATERESWPNALKSR